MKKSSIFTFIWVFLTTLFIVWGGTGSVYAQQSSHRRTVTGTVYDNNKEPLTGVYVYTEGGKEGTSTDINGSYTLSIPTANCKLYYTYIGMKPVIVNIPEGNEAVVQDVTLEDDNTLSEVVVTGYQNIAKPKMAGSAVSISAADLNERYNVNLVSSLEGQVAGVSTYGDNIKVRGTSSLYATTTPLLVIDGLPTEGRLEDLNQFNIQRITVLKDAAATAIYGARASNGVIVVTTKNASTDGKVEIDFTANYALYDRENVDYNDNFYMNARQQVQKESEYLEHLYATVADQAKSYHLDCQSGYLPISPLTFGYYQHAIGELSTDGLNALKDKLSKNNYAKEYADRMYRTRALQEYDLAIRTRSNKNTNNFNINFKHDNSGRINAHDHRIQLDYKGSFDLSEWVTARANINLTNNSIRKRGYDFSSYDNTPFQRPAYESFYNEDGSVRSNYGWFDGNELFDKDLPKGTVSLATNPMDELYNNVVNTKRTGARFHGEVLFKPFSGLTLSAQGVYERQHVIANWIANEKSHPARVIRDAFTKYDKATGVVSYPVMETGGFKQTNNLNTDAWTVRGQASYDKTFGNHAFNAIAGLEFREQRTTGSNALLLNFDEQLQTSNTITTNLLDLYNTRTTSYFRSSYPARKFAFDPYIRSGLDPVKEVHHRLASGFMNFTYTYRERYNIFGSFRKDYADVYGLNAKYRGKPLWSLGAAWNMEQERFLASTSWINYLKLRMSYGATGNIYQDATSYLTAKTGKLNIYSKLPYAYIESPANPELTWEKTNTYNIGVDFSFLNNRIRGALDFYNKNSSNVFSNKTLDATTGFTSMFVNAAKMRNSGMELQLTADWFRPGNKKPFGWSTSLTFSHNSNTVTHVDNPATYASELIDLPFKEGYPASALWSYRFAGIDDGKYGVPGQTLWYGNDGTISHKASSASPDVLIYSGQSDPKVTMGLDNRFMWNGISLSVMMVYYGGHVMRTHQQVEVFPSYYSLVPLYFVDSWHPKNNPDSKVPGWGEYGSTAIGQEPSYSDLSVHRADFIKIRNIALGYDLPRKFLNKINMNRLHLRFQINNPGFLWRRNNIHVDPETLGVSIPTSYVLTLNVNL